MKNRILFVDDDANLLAAFQRNLRRRFEFDTALGGEEGLAYLERSGPYALIVVDMRMPGMDGVEFLERARALAPDAVRIMLTGNADQQTAVDAVNRGQVFRFLNKPCPPDQLVPVIEQGLHQAALHRMEQELLAGTLTGSVRMLSEVLGMVAPEALGRGQRLRDAMRELVRFIGATPAWEFEVAALLSSLGSASLPPRLWRKMANGDELTAEETAIVARVPQVGHALLADIPRLKGVAEAVLYQRQNFDGTGNPGDGRAGDELPLAARLLRILNDRMELESEGVLKVQALKAMQAREGVYDDKHLVLSFACFPSFLTQSISAERPVRAVGVAKLQPGFIVVSDIKSPDGMTLVGAGHQLTEMMIQRLMNHAALGFVEEPVIVQDGPVAAVPILQG